ncbi:GNAT family N-acetyltransferase [Candidatus Collierbacteria bacterium]|nr:GNAT family N-acetyltransferase [Candidatus Collierbacteria bacterium]
MVHPEDKKMVNSLINHLADSDLEEIVRVEKNTWPADWQAPIEKFKARIAKFPQGAIGVFENGNLVGVSTSMRINFDPNTTSDYHKTWDQITGDGFIATHEPDGNTLYVVSVGVQKESQGNGYGQRLVAKQFELAKNLGCECLMLGARLPKFRESLSRQDINPDSLSATELIQKAQGYLDSKRNDGLRQEPEIRFYEKCGLKVLKLTDPNFGPDPESCNFGVIMLAEI